MRGRTGATAVASALTVALATLAHVLAGGRVPASAWPTLVAVGGSCLLLAMSGVSRRVLVVALGAAQCGLHLALGSAAGGGLGSTVGTSQAQVPLPVPPDPHAHHHGAVPAADVTPAVAGHAGMGTAMLAAHLGALLASVVLLEQAHRWWRRLVEVMSRALPGLPRPVLAAGPREVRAWSARPRPFARRWLSAGVRRRGPPLTGVALAQSHS